jgi:hypothetical protein
LFDLQSAHVNAILDVNKCLLRDVDGTGNVQFDINFGDAIAYASTTQRCPSSIRSMLK